MKYVVLIHSNPQPWGHPTIDFTEVGRAIPADQRAAMGKEFEEMLTELSASEATLETVFINLTGKDLRE